MSKPYHEEMENCPCQQGLRCSMNGDFCKEESCAPLFILRKVGHHIKRDRADYLRTVTPA